MKTLFLFIGIHIKNRGNNKKIVPLCKPEHITMRNIENKQVKKFLF